MDNQKQKKVTIGGKTRPIVKVIKTRKQILAAARSVFSRQPFASASIRTIETEGKFNHSAIYYHFKTKSMLFEEVVAEIYEECLAFSIEILNGLGRESLREDLSGAIDRLFYFFSHKSDILKILMLNIGETKCADEMADGFRYFKKYNETVYMLFHQNHPFQATQRTVNMWISAFITLIANYLGSPALFRQSLCMDSKDAEYRVFIKESLMLIFYAPLKALFYPSAYPAGRTSGCKRNKLMIPKKRSSHRLGNQPMSVSKGDVSRTRILDVARSVFARTPYNAASIRMIGDAGDFEFPLLYHYFPTKADLFEAVVKDIFDELSFFAQNIIVETKEDSIQDSLSVWINSVVDYFWSHPTGLNVCMQNVAQINSLDDFPGTHYILDAIAVALATYQLADIQANDEIRKIIYGMGAIVINFLGAPAFHGSILNMDPKSPRYKRWVKDMLMFVFYPSIKAHVIKWSAQYADKDLFFAG